jgi:hypothetical protein
MQQDMNQQAHLYGLAAALALLESPMVVGVIAFGLLNPDPAYAPTFQTTPEDRPSVLERAGETGLAIVIGAIGVKVGQAGSAAAGAEEAAVNGNSLRSQSAQHVYEILQVDVTGNTEVFKYGISGGPLNAAGLSVRAETQVRSLTRTTVARLVVQFERSEVDDRGEGVAPERGVGGTTRAPLTRRRSRCYRAARRGARRGSAARPRARLRRRRAACCGRGPSSGSLRRRGGRARSGISPASPRRR